MEWWKGDKKGNENKTDVKIDEVSKNLQISVDSEGNQLSEVAQNNLKELSLLSGKDEAGILSMIEQNNKENEATVLNLEENSKNLDNLDWESPSDNETPTNTEVKSQEMLDKMKADLENQKPVNSTLSVNSKPGTLDLNPQQSEFLKSTNQSQANEPNIDLSDSSQKYMEQVTKEKDQKKQDLFKDFKNPKNQKDKRVSSTNTIDNILGASGLNVTNFALRG